MYPPAEVTIALDDRPFRQLWVAHGERDGAAVAASLHRCASISGDGEGWTSEGGRIVYWQHCGALVVFVGVAGGGCGKVRCGCGCGCCGGSWRRTSETWSLARLTEVVGWSRVERRGGDVP